MEVEVLGMHIPEEDEDFWLGTAHLSCEWPLGTKAEVTRWLGSPRFWAEAVGFSSLASPDQAFWMWMRCRGVLQAAVPSQQGLAMGNGTASSAPTAGQELSAWAVGSWGWWSWFGLVGEVTAVNLGDPVCALAHRRHWKHARRASPRWSCSSSSSKWCSWRGWRMPRPGTYWGSSSTSCWLSWLCSLSLSPLWPTASCPWWRLAIGRSALYL